MSWNVINPDGTKSVKANATIGQDNTTYTKTTMNVSHFWDESATEDGHHKFAKMAVNAGGFSPLPTGIELAYYGREKTVGESAAQQDVQPYFENNTSNIMQLLAMRSCVVFNVVGGAVTVVYKHNVTSVVRTAKGRYTIIYDAATPLPSNAYLVNGGGIRSDANNDKLMNLQVASAGALNVTKTTTFVKVLTSDMSGSLIDPLQVWAVCFGG